MQDAKKLNIALGTVLVLIFLGVFFYVRNLSGPKGQSSSKNTSPAADQPIEERGGGQTDGLAMMAIVSPDFQSGQLLPVKYTCDGSGVNPAIGIDNIPTATKTLAIVVEDPDAPGGLFTHWMAWNISLQTKEIPENSSGGKQGINDFGQSGYGAPCPPQGAGMHHYIFRVLALDEELSFPTDRVKRSDFDQAIHGHVLDSADLVGTYSRQ